MNTKKVESVIQHIATLQESLCNSENNLQYIKRLQALKYWLHKFDSFLDRTSRQQFTKATFALVVDSHSTIEYVILSQFMSMETDHSKIVWR